MPPGIQSHGNTDDPVHSIESKCLHLCYINSNLRSIAELFKNVLGTTGFKVHFIFRIRAEFSSQYICKKPCIKAADYKFIINTLLRNCFGVSYKTEDLAEILKNGIKS